MSARPKILALAAVDALGVRSSAGLRASWEALGVEAPGTGRAFRALFGHGDDTFRRLDRPTRALVVAAEACGLARILSAEARAATALVVETARGSLEVDLRYVRALERGEVQGSIFPYTLQSTCLGDVALRAGLQGPVLSLSVAAEAEGEALAEARRMLAGGEVRHALVGRVEALVEPAGGLEPELRAVVALVAASDEPAPALLSWPDGTAPFTSLARALAGERVPVRE